MLPVYKARTNTAIVIAVATSGLGTFLALSSGVYGFVRFIFVFALSCYVYGCWAYAKGQGHHGLWGLLGLLSLPGLFILVLMSDKCKLANGRRLK